MENFSFLEVLILTAISRTQEIHNQKIELLRHALGEQILLALADPDVVEIMLNPDGRLWIESLGKMACVGEIAADDAMVILNLVSSGLESKTGVCDEHPLVEGELALGGERFMGVAPPVVERPSFAIRKPAGKIFTLNDYVRSSVLTFGQAETIRRAIRGRLNILVIGGTGSGKTTFCNALLHELSLISPEVRMLIIEDTRELQCTLQNKFLMRSTEHADMARLSQAVNRLRPDSISVGEVRAGGPALALLKLWNTGHPGGFATVHANSAYGGLTRMDQLIQEVSSAPQRVLIGEAVNIAVFLKKGKEGRRIEEIIQVNEYDPVTQKFVVEEVK
ncbi:P-type conjugative transfer ATPase TrbB [Janthinobacterium sp. CAN_S7]|uniref:P-type conjugative transfer ATPase TrbB n=1 Tax=Janthinobacterium sp. CAN_S7 TaxID=3071704 RepID=UPI00319E5FCC